MKKNQGPFAYITHASAYYPGEPVNNDAIDSFIAPLGAKCARMKRRILGENGIEQRHYALDTDGKTTQSVAEMACSAVEGVLIDDEVHLLAAATTGGDVSVPGFANMVHGELGLPPMKTASLSGVCASSINALDFAVSQIVCGQVKNAIVVAAEMPSRLFKKSRVERAKELSFDAHFLRWMLSDGAGAWRLQDRPLEGGLSLRVDFVHAKSFAGDYPTCMQVGMGEGNDGPGYLDYDSLEQAEAAGAYLLRQDIRMLPCLFDVAVHEYAELVEQGKVNPQAVDHFLAHYSSERFRGVMHDLMAKAGLLIDPDKWYSNLKFRGNMGAASIMTMLADFLSTKGADLKPGQQLLLFVPESGRYMVSFVGLTVVGADVDAAPVAGEDESGFLVPPTEHANPQVQHLLQELLGVWHDYRSQVLRSELARKVFSGSLTPQEYCAWMAGWIGQVRQGAHWMRSAAANLPDELGAMRALIEMHAGEEQNDWKVLFADYRAAGGEVDNVDELRMNPGAAALNAYIHQVASSADAACLLGATYIIEGTGNRIVPTLLPHIKKSLGEASHATRFLEYHGKADIEHMQRWLMAIEMLVSSRPEMAEKLVRTARDVANLYALSWRSALG